MRAQVEQALGECASRAEGYAKALCPVDTGTLRDSITHSVSSDAATIGTNVPYAVFVELGTHKQAPQPFLQPAAEGHASEYMQVIEQALRA